MEHDRCRVHECGSDVIARGMCWKHYQRHRRHGSADTAHRRFEDSHECRYCGTRNPGDFYASYKGICKTCRKIRRIQGAQRVQRKAA